MMKTKTEFRLLARLWFKHLKAHFPGKRANMTQAEFVRKYEAMHFGRVTKPGYVYANPKGLRFV